METVKEQKRNSIWWGWKTYYEWII